MLAALAFAVTASPDWIWAPGPPIPDRVYFRKDFILHGQPKSAEIAITCDNAYQVFVNGVPVASHADWYTMQAVDLKPRLRLGRNVVAVLGKNFGSVAGLLVSGTVVTTAGTVILDTDGDWRASTELAPGWTAAAFDDSKWGVPEVIGPEGIAPWGKPPSELDLLDEELAIRSERPLSSRKPVADSPDVAAADTWPKSLTGEQGRFVRMPIDPASMDGRIGQTIRKDTTLKVDFGRETSGWVEVEVEGAHAPNATIRIGEAQTPQGPFPTYAQHAGNRTIYRLLPTDAFTGFRFAWIDFRHVSSPVKIVRVQAIWRMWPANYEGQFACSDPMLGKIWQICAFTAHLNLDPKAFTAILRPERGDRIPWMGDDRVSHLTAMNAFGDYGLVRADLDSFLKPGQKKIDCNGIPGYTLDWVIALYDYWMRSGDSAEVRRHLGDVRTILESLDTQGTPPGWLFTDWEPGLQSTSPASVLAFHCKYVEAADLGTVMARAMGSHDLAKEFQGLGAKRAAFLRSSAGWPQGLEQHVLTNAILAGLVRAFPASLPAYTATPYFTYYVLEALSEAGQDKRALAALRFYWGSMVKVGATSTWEYFHPSWVGKMKPTHQPPDEHDPKVADFVVSLCHPWSSGAATWLSEHVLGVTPTAPGFAKASIVPMIDALAWARGSVPTPKGPISISWKRTGRRVVLRVRCPLGVRANLVLPPGGKVSVDGKPDNGSIWLTDGREHTVERLAG